jgi:hypothetical protein
MSEVLIQLLIRWTFGYAKVFYFICSFVHIRSLHHLIMKAQVVGIYKFPQPQVFSLLFLETCCLA